MSKPAQRDTEAMGSDQPEKDFTLSVVIIGRNVSKWLEACILSVKSMRRTFPEPEIIYVDSASSDESVSIARKQNVKVVELTQGKMNAARGRNAGWRQCSSEYILFLDGDTELDPDYVEQTKKYFQTSEIAVIWGQLREKFPERNFFHQACDLDWVYPVGEADFCGGIALIRKKVIEKISGYDERLSAGEEPEMCRRMIGQGFKIIHADVFMAHHDIDISSWRQYWRRAVRSGYAYAEVIRQFPDTAPKSFFLKFENNFYHAAIILASLILAVAGGIFFKTPVLMTAWLAGAAAVVIRSMIKNRWKTKDLQAQLIYAVHSHLIKIPQAYGQILYLMSRQAQAQEGGKDEKRP